MSSTQKRCVFVGNIPYDATEEELIRICEEVGPVVSFRLVLDRDTGKPKGYGFCEFRDEETALSARRNLQGYEINGRQLRVDFAENEKGGVDRNREQGRGGPGFSSINDVHKHTGGVSSQVASTLLDPSINKPVGLSVAAAAAAVMAGALGASQMPMMMGQGANLGSNGQPNSSGVGAGAAIGSDPLTSHLASMSKHQLYEIVSQMKDLIQQNQQQARQILIANPQLTKALFQAQIMLGMVPPPAVMPSIQQPPGQNTSSQSQSQTQVPQQQIVHQPQMQPPQTQAVQPFHIQTAPQIQAVQQGQIQASQMQQHQMQAVQTSQSPDMEMQSTQSQMQAPQPSQILPFQHSLPPLQQSHAQTSSVQPPIQSVPQISSHSIGMQPQVPSVQVAQPQPPPLQQSNLLPQHLQPPLPQQPRPPIPVPLSQLQLQPTQSMSFQLPSIPQQQSLPQLPFQQPGGLAQNSSMGLHYQQQPPLLNQPPPQQAFQLPRSGVDVSGGPGIGQGGISSSVGMMVGSISTGLGAPQVGRGPSMGVSSGPAPPMAWNQPPSSSGSMGVIAGVPHTSASMGMAGHMGPGHSLSMPGGPTGSGAPHIHQDINVKGFGSLRGNTGVGIGGPSEGLGVSGMVHSQGYTQVMQTPPHPQQQPQMQPSLELEQQKALLQQVMNLTPEQINSLPPEQRQQVMQLQQAFRN